MGRLGEGQAHYQTIEVRIFSRSRARRLVAISIFSALILSPTLFEMVRISIAGTSNLPKNLYTDQLRNYSNVEIVFDKTYELLSKAEAAIVKSGTSTLEAALFNVPEVVVYTMNALTYRIAKAIVKKNISYISLVNLILNKKSIPELIQNDFNVDMITEELRKILSNRRQYAGK